LNVKPVQLLLVNINTLEIGQNLISGKADEHLRQFSEKAACVNLLKQLLNNITRIIDSPRTYWCPTMKC